MATHAGTALLIAAAVGSFACGRVGATSVSPAVPTLTPAASRIEASRRDFLGRAPADTRWVGRIFPKDFAVASLGGSAWIRSGLCDIDPEQVSRVDLAAGPDAFVVEVLGTLSIHSARCVVEKAVTGESPLVEVIPGGLRVASRRVQGNGPGVPQTIRELVDKTPPTDSIVAGILPAESQASRLLASWHDDLTIRVELTPSASGALVDWWTAASKSMPSDARSEVVVTRNDPWLTFRIRKQPALQALATAAMLRRYVVESFKIPSATMSPTLLVGDHVLVDKSATVPARGAMMVFRSPEKEDASFVKRVIALSGDTVEVFDGRPILNGKLVPHCYVGLVPPAALHAAVDPAEQPAPLHTYVESLGGHTYLTGYVQKPTDRSCSADKDCVGIERCRAGYCGELQGPYVVTRGEGWVLGDNRNNSYDSRNWFDGRGGGVPPTHWIGTVGLVYLSVAPDGSVRWERLFHSSQRPLAPGSDARLQQGILQCLQSLGRGTE